MLRGMGYYLLLVMLLKARVVFLAACLKVYAACLMVLLIALTAFR